MSKIRVKPINEELSKHQAAFLDSLMKHGNATRAAVEAGYSKKTASRIAHENLIKLYFHIDKRSKKYSDERIADAEEVLMYLTSVMRGDIKDELIRFYQGNVVRAKVEITARDKIRAAELLGKRYRLFADRVEAEANTQITVTMADDVEDWSK